VLIARRFEPLFLSRWTDADAFRSFGMAYGRLLPLRNPSASVERAMTPTRTMVKQVIHLGRRSNPMA
jgi:hypothetical protein